MATPPETQNTSGRRLTAVPDSATAKHGEGAHFRLGITSTEPAATFVIGEAGPNGQRLPWIYLKSGVTRYEIAMDDGKLTVASENPQNGKSQAVVYNIDVAAMTGREITTGEPVSIIFAYDEKTFADVTPEIDEWVATTGPRFGAELESRLGASSDAVIETHALIEQAKQDQRFGEATKAPRSAQPVVDLTIDPLDVNVEIDLDLPEGVQIFDPQTGKTYVGRRWVRENEKIAVSQLLASGYKLAIVRFNNGDMATLMPNFRGKTLGVQYKNSHGMVDRVLDESAMDAPLGPGYNLKATVISTFNGDTSKAGPFASPFIKSVTGVGPAVEDGIELDLPVDTALQDFRQNDFDLVG